MSSKRKTTGRTPTLTPAQRHAMVKGIFIEQYIDSELERRRAHYEHDHNPLWVWEALLVWSEAGDIARDMAKEAAGDIEGDAEIIVELPPLPKWVLKYLVLTGSKLRSVVPGKKKLPVQVKAALGFSTAGKGDCWSRKKRVDELDRLAQLKAVAAMEGEPLTPWNPDPDLVSQRETERVNRTLRAVRRGGALSIEEKADVAVNKDRIRKHKAAKNPRK
jgi:hypothetical protein